MGKNPAVVKPGRAASPSKPSQNCQFTLKTAFWGSLVLPRAADWCASQTWSAPNETAHPTGVEKTVRAENPAWNGAPGCQIRASAYRNSSQVPSTQWWSLIFFILPIFASQDIFVGCFSVVSLASFGVSLCRNSHLQAGLCTGDTWNTFREPFQWGLEGI